MELIWVGLFFVILVVSFFLAMRSMKNFQDIPLPHLDYALFLVQNKASLNQELLKKIHSLALSLECIVSFERLTKGDQAVLALYAPKQLIDSIPEIGPLELEDYVSIVPPEDNNVVASKKVLKDTSLPWVIAPKNSKKDLSFDESFFSKINLSEMQHFFWQIVMQPLKDSNNFQVTIRALVSEKDPAERVTLAKHIDNLINETTGLIKESKAQSSGSIFEAFAKRTITPREVVKFELTDQEILKLLN